MGSVTRRISRNIRAKNIATRVGIVQPVMVGRHLDGRIRYFPPSTKVPLIHYRATMLRVLRHIRNRQKYEHDLHQKKTGRKSKIASFFGSWSKSWIRRMLEKIFPSLNKEVREAQKAERERKRQLRELTPELRRAVENADSARKVGG